ncbi:MAG: DNA mismatch repair protein MutS [Candidatus Dormibacteraeota bacterium]|nr:DNA mismatch repair protein MutS [Candidatus Dormibacteraeota bacterium]
MKPHLLFSERDYDGQGELPDWSADLSEDLGLEAVWSGMSGGDRFLWDVARRVILDSLQSTEEIDYRQEVARDFLAHPEALEKLYQVAVDAVESERRIWGLSGRHPAGALHHGVEVLSVLMPAARRLRDLSAGTRVNWTSRGLTQFADSLGRDLSDDYLDLTDSLLTDLRLESGALFGATLGVGGGGSGYLLLRPSRRKVPLGERLGVRERSRHAFTVDPRDESGLRALGNLADRGLAGVARSVSQAADHVLAFFRSLRFELGFYLGCLNLHRALAVHQLPTCWPRLEPADELRQFARGLYDLTLPLRDGTLPVGNDLEADGCPLLVITGANSGGKSTFLRGLALAQLLAQAGMFVGAREFASSVATSIHTHFVRPEDESMSRGRLADELERMSKTADQVAAGGLVLMNESFSSTNELEGSEIARQVTTALLESGVRVAIVTHFFELAGALLAAPPRPAVFLRAERLPDGRRTYRLLKGEPLATAFGSDLLKTVDLMGGARG